MNVAHLLATYGYGAVFLCITIESTGIPFPGETMLLIAAIAAGTTHQLSIPLVIVAAASGAILGDNLGFWIGREGGYHLLRRYGRFVRLDERKLKLGQYLFLKHGGKVVFFGRFVTVLRAWAASLSGTNQMRWSRFLFFLRTHQHRLEEEAERALPGSLDDYRKGRREEKPSRASQFL
jgi:membrane protein DedA with SNARE-associated domain